MARTFGISGKYLIPSEQFEPAYLSLFRTGELQRRAKEAVASLKECHSCARRCGVNRLESETGVCRTGRYAYVSSYFPHHGEENCLRGYNGSGTIFFTWCGLRCVFCQNSDISHDGDGVEASPERLARMMLHLQSLGCDNINFVTPSHVVAQILEALVMAVEGGLRVPLVYNTSAYDSLESLRLLDGIVDIYMPDFKIWDPEKAQRYLRAPDYPEVARRAILEMHRQVGVLKFDENGIAKRGVLVRHLVMPEEVAGTEHILRFLAEEVASDTHVNVMAQYHPAGLVSSVRYPEINRRITSPEYWHAVQLAEALGLRLDERW